MEAHSNLKKDPATVGSIVLTINNSGDIVVGNSSGDATTLSTLQMPEMTALSSSGERSTAKAGSAVSTPAGGTLPITAG